jgi:integrase/recombinase XerD
MQVLRTSDIIENYLESLKNEINISASYAMLISYVLQKFNKFIGDKDLRGATQQDIISFLDSLKKPEPLDPMHKWIGTYNTYFIVFSRFFKWLHNPIMDPGKRPKPEIMKGLSRIRRKEKSTYKPTDLWTVEDDILFLKYCPSKRDRCYHMMARDSSCRPHELLKLKIKDVVFKMAGDKQYAEVLVNGKTGQRHIPLINSIPYIKDWLDDHPQRRNPSAALFYGNRRSLGRGIGTVSLHHIYMNYKTNIFSKLLLNPTIPPEDKRLISELLRKPWNPYIRRHTALTEKSKFLKESVLRQHAGWTNNSDMPNVYLHYFGNESSESILEAYGLKSKSESADKMKPVQCPNCGESCKIDSKFCPKCRMVLSYDAYAETVEEKQDNSDALTTLSDQIERLTIEVQQLKRAK